MHLQFFTEHCNKNIFEVANKKNIRECFTREYYFSHFLLQNFKFN